VNVLKFVNDDGTTRYAISDFGLISAVASETTTLTQTGHGGGTPIYAAPELITKFKHATASADIYSFGAILHDIFDGGTRTPYLELTTSGPCREIVEKCTKTNPGRRYPDVASLRADIFHALVGKPLTFTSNAEREIVDLLQMGTPLNDAEWDRVYNFLSAESTTKDSHRNVFAALSTAHIQALAESSAELFNAVGTEFSTYVRSNQHNFDYCDVLADKLEAIYELASTSLKAHSLITLLILGVDHNRWFVERKFVRIASPYMDVNVAERIRMDVVADDLKFEEYMQRLEKSISIERKTLHKLLAQK
jgi:serine/threonine protein kinase